MTGRARGNDPFTCAGRPTDPGPSIARGRATTSGLGGTPRRVHAPDDARPRASGTPTADECRTIYPHAVGRTGAPPHMSTPDRTVAGRLAGLVGEVFGGRLPVRIRAWDGSEAGPADAPVVVLRSRTALRRLLWDPNELGLARAYVAGEVDVEGDLAEGLSRVWSLVRERPPALPGVRDQLRWARTASGWASWAAARPHRRRRRCSRARSTPPTATATRSATTTTRATTSTRHCSTSTWPTPAPTSARTRPPTPVPPTAATPSPRPSATSWSWSAASSACSRACGCWTSAAGGAR